MIESLKTRWAIIVVVVAMAIVWNIPNFTKVNPENWFTKEKLIYGLDIQGGLHLVMGVDVNGVVTEKIAREARNIKEELKDRAITFDNVEVDPNDKKRIIISFAQGTSEEQIKKYIEDNYAVSLQVIETTPGSIVVMYYDTQVNNYKKQVVEQAIEVIRNRIDEFGVSEPSISAQGEDRILVQLPGIKDSVRAKELINRTARLDFRGVSTEKSEAEVAKLIEEAEKAGDYALGKNEMAYSAYVKKLNEDLKDKLPKNTRIVFEKLDNAVKLEDGKQPYLVDTVSDLSGGELEDAVVRPGEFGSPEVNFRFSVQGRRKFAELTEKFAGGRLAIVLDDVVKSAPTVKEKIDSASARIELGQGRDYQSTQNEAQFIATSLRAGALPAALEQLEERTVGPTLGADSIAKGKKAGIIGGILVLLFMLAYYRKLGVVADISLAVNVLLLLAILTSLGATLTLPGVAGIVLTVGMAVDANVIIFERIKEELRKGTGLRASIKDGFGHAFSAIFDANITTAIVCVVLMYFGTGPVRGFAVTLLCGIFTSMFTAIFVSRSLLDLMVGPLKLKKVI